MSCRAPYVHDLFQGLEEVVSHGSDGRAGKAVFIDRRLRGADRKKARAHCLAKIDRFLGIGDAAGPGLFVLPRHVPVLAAMKIRPCPQKLRHFQTRRLHHGTQRFRLHFLWIAGQVGAVVPGILDGAKDLSRLDQEIVADEAQGVADDRILK